MHHPAPRPPSDPCPPPSPTRSFYSAVSASGLADAVQSLSSGGTPPRWVVIDDGWQCTEVRRPPGLRPGGAQAGLPRQREACGRQAEGCAAATRCWLLPSWRRPRMPHVNPSPGCCLPPPLAPAQVDAPYRNIPTEQLKEKLLKEKAEPVGAARGAAAAPLLARRRRRTLRLAASLRLPPPEQPHSSLPIPPVLFIATLPTVRLQAGDASLREAYLEGEMEALGQAAKEIPAGTAMGAYLQEIRASGARRRALPAPPPAAGQPRGRCGGRASRASRLVPAAASRATVPGCPPPPHPPRLALTPHRPNQARPKPIWTRRWTTTPWRASTW